MWMPERGKPSFWKALMVAGLFGLPLAWGLHLVIRAPSVAWDICVPVVILAAAAIINSVMLNDWRASDTMTLQTFEKRTSVGRNIRIGRK